MPENLEGKLKRGWKELFLKIETWQKEKRKIVQDYGRIVQDMPKLVLVLVLVTRTYAVDTLIC